MSAKHRGRLVANHELYPLEIEELFNRDEFFHIWEPEYFTGDWEPKIGRVIKKSDFIKCNKYEDSEIHIYKGCIQCRDPNCEFIFANSGGHLALYSYCDYEVATWIQEILTYNDFFYRWENIKKISARAELSTHFLNPFETPKLESNGDPFRIIAQHQFDNEQQQISWLIEDLIPANSIGSLVGPSGSCKSFVALSMAKSISANVSFMNRETAFGTVLYLAPDGGDQIGPRLKAWDVEHGRDGWYTRFYSNHHLINLESEEFFSRLSMQLKANEDFNYKLLVIDSLKKSIETSDSDDAIVAKVFRNLSKLKNETGISILLIDHTGHKTGQRASGSYQKHANNDFEYFVKKEGTQVTLVNKKMRAAYPPKDFVMNTVPRHGSLILEASEAPPSQEDIILQLIEKSDEIAPDDLQRLFINQFPDVADTTRRRWFNKAIGTLLEENEIEETGGALRRTYS